jgi:hypothetical protein
MRRVLKALALVLLGAVLSAAAFFSWYNWGKSTSGPTSIPVKKLIHSQPGMKPTTCEISASQSDALAYGTLTKQIGGGFTSTINLFVLGSGNEVLGSAQQSFSNVTKGQNWTLHAHLLQGFGSPVTCYVSFNYPTFLALRHPPPGKLPKHTSGYWLTL